MTTLIAELATNHGGDLELAARMIRDAAACGATHAKVQAYQTKFLRPDDKQFAWLRQAELSELALSRLSGVCHDEGVKFLATVFDVERVQVIRELTDEVKIGSGDAMREDLRAAICGANFSRVYVGCGIETVQWSSRSVPLASVPAYPAPESESLLAIARMMADDAWGYSDHTVTLKAVHFALSLGASVIEVHTALAGSPKRLSCDKSPKALSMIAEWCRNGPTLPLDLAAYVAVAREQYVGRWEYKPEDARVD